MSYGSLTRVRLSMQAQSGSAARTVAEQMQAKLDAGKTLTAEDRGRLAQANPLETAKMLQQSAGRVRLATPQVNVGNDDVRWQQAQRLAGVTGRNIVFYNGSPNENGYFDRKTGEIYVNANGGDPAVQTFAHELTHSTEMAEVYKDLQKICFQKLQSLGQDIGQMRKDKMALYERDGHPLQNESEADQEILASFVEQYLLTDEQVIADVVYDDPGIGRRILNWIDRILAKLGNESAQERLFLQNARSLYSKALQQTRNRPWRQGENVSDSGTSPTAAQSDPEMEASIQEMQEALERGDLTEDEYNVIVENIRQEFQRRSGGRQYSFAGENARTADLAALQQAKELQAQGVANETIRQQTGWFRGSDGKWRWEIDDSGMKYFRAGDARFSQMHEDYARHQELTSRFIDGDLSQQEMNELEALDEIWGRERGRLNRRVTDGDATLQNLIQHDALFEAYPELRGVKVRFENLNRNELGQFYRNANLIVLSNSLRNAPQSTILHEVQHAIQEAEGFASGSSRAYWDARVSSGDTPETKGLADARRRWEAFEQDPANAEAMDLIHRLSDAEESGDAYSYEALEQEAERRGLMDKIREHEQLEMEYYSQESRAFNMMPSELYENTAGEIEARDVSGRMGLDAEGRKNTPPNLGGERTVFADDAHVFSSEKDHIKDQIRDSAVILDTMDPVVSIVVPQWIKSADKDTKQQWAIDQLEYTGYSVNRDGRGEILFPEKRLRAGFNYFKIGDPEEFIFEALPYVLKNGVELVDKDIHKGRQYGTFTIGAPILVNGKRGNLAVVVKKTTDNFYKVHRILSPDGSLFVLEDINEEAEPTSGGGVTTSGSLAAPISSAYKFSLAQNKSDVKQQYSLNDGGQQSFETVRDNLNRKASDYLKGIENRFVRRLGDQLGIPRYAQWDTVRPVIQEMSDEFMKTGRISDEAIAKAFDTAYDQGKVIDREFYDQYKEVKDYLRTTAVTLSERDRADIADFNQWRKGAFGILRIVNEGGMPVDTAYAELQTMAPGLFPDWITHPADQLQQMAEVGRRILNWIDRILAKLGNESAQEGIFLQNARSLYSKALQQTRNRPWRQGENVSDSDTSPTATQGDPEMEASIQEMRQVFEQGYLTKDE